MPNPQPDEQAAPSHALPKVPTGIAGLDDVLHGGLPEGRTTLISGGPGAGKSVLALESLYRGALAGRPGIFVTFEEPADAVRQNAWALGWDVAALERAGKLFIMHADVSPDTVLSGDFDIGGLLAILGGQAGELGARCVVLDALDVLIRFFPDTAREHNQLHTLNNWLRERDLTTLLTVKALDSGSVQYPFLDFIADCVIRLDQRVSGQISTRRLRVQKYRGSGFISNECPFLIDRSNSSGGLEVMPVPSIMLAQHLLEERVPTGNDALDLALSGGFWCGSCTLITGASGTGKTTFACTFAAAACQRGERVLYVSFEESAEQLINAMRSPGIELDAPQAAGRLRLLSVMPETLGFEQHLHQIRRAIQAFGPAHVIVDAVSAARRMGSEDGVFDFLVRLLTHCKNNGITCVFTNQVTPADAQRDASGIDIASLVDTLVQLNLELRNHTHERTLLVIKSRGSRHSQVVHRFAITDNGVVVAEAPSEGEAG